MSNRASLSTASAHQTSCLAAKTPLKRSCIAARRLFHWAASYVLLWAWWRQLCTSTLLFPGSTDIMLRYRVSYLQTPSPILFLFSFFSFSDRPTQNQKTHSAINGKKRMALSFEIKIKILFAVRVSRDMERITLKRRKNKQIRYESQANSVTNVLITPFSTVLHAMSD